MRASGLHGAPSRRPGRPLMPLKLLCLLVFISSTLNTRAIKCSKLSIKNQTSQPEWQHPVHKRLTTLDSINQLTPSKEYMCARHCSCTLVQAIERSGGLRLNQTMASCESVLFRDLLTIDRRTHIIHISLPRQDPSNTSSQEVGRQQATEEPQEQSQFRMPRLAQFQQLNEIVIVNLKFEVCDTEVFKRGQKLRRLKLNHNQLSRLSRSCFRHLDQLIELNLNHNKLGELESALFGSLSKLRSLSIAHNLLTGLAAHQFSNLTQLVSLNLVGNAFTSINLHLFEPMQFTLRLLTLANNQIKTFTYSTFVQSVVSNPTAANKTANIAFSGPLFKNLVKLNVDNNRLERVKSLQLHRFFNIKYLSIRFNLIGSIRDKAFNGLKLIELNLGNNQLQSISKCAFCNSTVKRLVLSSNNISLTGSIPSAKRPIGAELAISVGSQSPLASALVANENESEPLLVAAAGAPPQNILILSQSILSPLYAQLNYLDLSNNPMLGDQLDSLLEPLLNLEYLNLAHVRAGPYLVSPDLFKNIQRLRYLNLSHNQLNQFQAEILEPLQQLEVLDLSYNKFDELDESLLVVIDEITALKVVNLAHNPWYCSQCKITPLYDWSLRSPIYNATCLAPTLEVANEQPTIMPNGESLPPPYTTESQFVSDDLVDFELLMDGKESEYLADIRDTFGYDEGVSPIRQTLNMLFSLDSSSLQFEPSDYCLRCEEPFELQTFTIHELDVGDFKFCLGAAPRLMSSEPRLGLTLAIVIIGALFCLIVIVIIIYRRKSNTYYPQEDIADSGSGTSRKKQVTSSDGEQRFAGDLTDYSSPPMSQSNESYSNEVEEEEEDEEEDVYDEAQDEDEEEEGEDENERQKHNRTVSIREQASNKSSASASERAPSSATDIDEEIPVTNTENSNDATTTKLTKIKTKPAPVSKRSSSGPTPRQGSRSHRAPTERQSSAHAAQVAGFVASQVAWRNSTHSSVSSNGVATPKQQPQQVASLPVTERRETPSMISSTPGSGVNQHTSSGNSRHLNRQHVSPHYKDSAADGVSDGAWVRTNHIVNENWQDNQDAGSTSGGSLAPDGLGSLELAPTPEDFEELVSSGGALVPAQTSLELGGHEQHKLVGGSASRPLRSSNSTHSALTVAGTPQIEEE